MPAFVIFSGHSWGTAVMGKSEIERALRHAGPPTRTLPSARRQDYSDVSPDPASGVVSKVPNSTDRANQSRAPDRQVAALGESNDQSFVDEESKASRLVHPEHPSGSDDHVHSAGATSPDEPREIDGPPDGEPSSRGIDDRADAEAVRPVAPPSSALSSADGDVRVARVWRGWLKALACDPEAALAAAQAYQRLDERGRSEWLDALQPEVESLGVPPVALYAPLLAVESDPYRRMRIIDGIQPSGREASLSPRPPAQRDAFKGTLEGGSSVAVLVEPLYLDFVQVLACGFIPGRELLWVRHDPIATRDRVPTVGSEIEGAIMEATSLTSLIDDLATTVVAHRRERGALPEALCSFAHLFSLECREHGQDYLEGVPN